MSEQDTAFWSRAQRARDRLERQYIDNPDVSLIDIGYAPEPAVGAREIAIRIHVRARWLQASPQDRVKFPEIVDGIPVVVIPGAYTPETGLSTDDDT